MAISFWASGRRVMSAARPTRAVRAWCASMPTGRSPAGSRAAHDPAGERPVGMEAHHARTARVGLAADITRRPDAQKEIAIWQADQVVVLMLAVGQVADHPRPAGQAAILQVV